MNGVDRSAHARAALKALRAEQENLTQEEINVDYERRFQKNNESYYGEQEVVDEEPEPEARRLVRSLPPLVKPVKPGRKKDPAAQILGGLGWTFERRRRASKLLSGNHYRAGMVPWNKGLRKETNAIMKFISDYKKYQIELNSRED